MATTTIEEIEGPSIPWWLILLQGIASLIVGILLLASPGATIFVLVQLLGVYWLVSGVFQIVAIFIDRRGWGWKLLWGIFGIIAGLVVLQHPLWSALLVPLTLVWILGFLAIGGGIVGIILGIKDRSWGIGILSVLNVLLGVFLLGNEVLGATLLVWVLAGAGIIGGIGAIAMSFHERALQHTPAAPPTTAPGPSV
jgi:uncharacterized membrane protein HdeD (DUF308 family)